MDPVGLTLIEAGKARLLWDVILGIGVCMMMASILLIAKPGEPGARKQNWTEVSKRLKIINSVQWSAIGLAILVLNVLHKVSLLPWVISVVVGIHFLPMGFIMRLTSYKARGLRFLPWISPRSRCRRPFAMDSRPWEQAWPCSAARPSGWLIYSLSGSGAPPRMSPKFLRC